MDKSKKIFLSIISVIGLTIIFGIMSDWKYYGFTNLFFSDTDEIAEEKRPKVKPIKNPNLLVENVFITPKSPKIGDTISMIAKIKNTGQEEIDLLKVKFTDQNGWGATQKTSIKGDLYKYVKVELKVFETHKGEHNFRVEIDSNQKIKEESEDDNLYEFILSVKE